MYVCTILFCRLLLDEFPDLDGFTLNSSQMLVVLLSLSHSSFADTSERVYDTRKRAIVFWSR